MPTRQLLIIMVLGGLDVVLKFGMRFVCLFCSDSGFSPFFVSVLCC